MSTYGTYVRMGRALRTGQFAEPEKASAEVVEERWQQRKTGTAGDWAGGDEESKVGNQRRRQTGQRSDAHMSNVECPEVEDSAPLRLDPWQIEVGGPTNQLAETSDSSTYADTHRSTNGSTLPCQREL